MKNVQISETLFVDLVKYFLLDMQDTDTYNAIRKGIEAKYEAIEKRKLYTDYKMAGTLEKQEQARTAYLDKVNIPDSFRY